MKKIIFINTVILLWIVAGYSIHPTVDWTKAGANIGQPLVVRNGISSVTQLKSELLNRDRSKLTLINLTGNTFVFENGETLELDSNVIIHGAGPLNTKLLFNRGDDSSHWCGIKVTGKIIYPVIQIDDNYPQCIGFKSNYLVLEDAATIQAGDYIKFFVNHQDIWNTPYGTYSDIGQLLKIT